MQTSGAFVGRSALAVILVVILFAGSAWAASHKVLHSFQPDGLDGVHPMAGLIADAVGNLYGTADSGGVYNVGAVFELSPNGSGGWTEKLLYSFKPNGSDGQQPNGGLLVLDGAGNLYGTTPGGGIHCVPNGCGTVFELSPNQDGTWTETVLHSFGGGSDGAYPFSGLALDAHGNLYGTTEDGGIYGEGTVFEVSPLQGGGWTETVLHNFKPDNVDGVYPQSGLISDPAGNFYGTTAYGGIHCLPDGCGTVFEMSPREDGGWTEMVLHSFGSGSDGAEPEAGLILDSHGNLYGSTYEGGIHSSCSANGFAIGCGTVFELLPNGRGGWDEVLLHSFNFNGIDGTNPQAGLAFMAGNLYGTTPSGGAFGLGTVFELSPQQGGDWAETVVHNFNDSGDGFNPYSALVLDASGNLLGTTENGGVKDNGAVFELQPREGGGWMESVAYNFFFDGRDGDLPYLGNLVFDTSGSLYGTTETGGTYDSGTVFELVPSTDGTWTEAVLYNFGQDLQDARTPASGLVRDASGNLYGTTLYGGIHCVPTGCGTVFELSPREGGGYAEILLHSFGAGVDGSEPLGGLVLDASGNLYGTTTEGGTHFAGTVFELSPRQAGGYTETVIHSFNPADYDGASPWAGLIVDSNGNLFGTTTQGGLHGIGTVFELSPNGSGGWNERALHSFGAGSDGALPYAGLTIDSNGNLFGTTYRGGIHYNGTVFELSPNGSGGWNERVLHDFNCSTEGCYFLGGVTLFGFSPNLYGATREGGVSNAGTVFELAPTQGGNYAGTVLHNFNPSNGDGGYPESGLIFDASGNVYGTTSEGGGNYNAGTVVEIEP